MSGFLLSVLPLHCLTYSARETKVKPSEFGKDKVKGSGGKKSSNSRKENEMENMEDVTESTYDQQSSGGTGSWMMMMMNLNV